LVTLAPSPFILEQSSYARGIQGTIKFAILRPSHTHKSAADVGARIRRRIPPERMLRLMAYVLAQSPSRAECIRSSPHLNETKMQGKSQCGRAPPALERHGGLLEVTAMKRGKNTRKLPTPTKKNTIFRKLLTQWAG